MCMCVNVYLNLSMCVSTNIHKANPLRHIPVTPRTSKSCSPLTPKPVAVKWPDLNPSLSRAIVSRPASRGNHAPLFPLNERRLLARLSDRGPCDRRFHLLFEYRTFIYLSIIIV